MVQVLTPASALALSWVPKQSDGSDGTPVDLKAAAALDDFSFAVTEQPQVSYPGGGASQIVTPFAHGLALSAPAYAGARVRQIAAGFGTVKVGVASLGVASDIGGLIVQRPYLAASTFRDVIRHTLAVLPQGKATKTVSADGDDAAFDDAGGWGGFPQVDVGPGDVADARVPRSALVLKVGPAGGTQVALGVDHGLSAVRPGFEPVLPGRPRSRPEFDGSVSSVGGGFAAGGISFEVNLTAATKMFWLLDTTAVGAAGSIGAPFSVEYGPYGTAAGMPKITFSGPCYPVFFHRGGVLGFEVTITLSGALVEGVYS